MVDGGVQIAQPLVAQIQIVEQFGPATQAVRLGKLAQCVLVGAAIEMRLCHLEVSACQVIARVVRLHLGGENKEQERPQKNHPCAHVRSTRFIADWAAPARSFFLVQRSASVGAGQRSLQVKNAPSQVELALQPGWFST